MGREELLSRVRSEELTGWMAYFKVKAIREENERRHREFLGSEDHEEYHW